jgi:hypothetical protein
MNKNSNSNKGTIENVEKDKANNKPIKEKKKEIQKPIKKDKPKNSEGMEWLY